jgi:hypothetical protein
MVFYTISTGLVTGVLSCFVLVLVCFGCFISFYDDKPAAQTFMGQFAKDGFEFSVLIVSLVGYSVFRSPARSSMSMSSSSETNTLVLS